MSLFTQPTKIKQEDAIKIREDLKSNTSIEIISLMDRHIDDECAKIIAEGIKANHSLTEIRLSANQITSVGLQAIIDAIGDKKIQTLSLTDNKIGDEGAEALAKFLQNNNTLTSLSLDGCGITNQGAKKLSEALDFNKTLRHLDLDSDISDEILKEIARNVQEAQLGLKAGISNVRSR